jgi:hypothetical protein
MNFLKTYEKTQWIQVLKGMKKELGSKDPIRIAKKLMHYFIKYEEYEKCAVLKKLIDEYEDVKS